MSVSNLYAPEINQNYPHEYLQQTLHGVVIYLNKGKIRFLNSIEK